MCKSSSFTSLTSYESVERVETVTTRAEEIVYGHFYLPAADLYTVCTLDFWHVAALAF